MNMICIVIDLTLIRNQLKKPFVAVLIIIITSYLIFILFVQTTYDNIDISSRASVRSFHRSHFALIQQPKINQPAPVHNYNTTNIKRYNSTINNNIFYLNNEQTKTSILHNNKNPRVIIATIAFYDKPNRLVIDNHLHYAKKHHYDYFILRKQISHKFMQRHGRIGTQQRVMLIYKLLFDNQFEMNKILNQTYDIVLWIDFDAIFLNDSIKIENLINNTIDKYHDHNSTFDKMNINNYDNNSYHMHCYNITHDSLSMIVSGDYNLPINAGVLIFIKNNNLESLINIWYNIMVIFPMDDQLSLYMALFGNQTLLSHLDINLESILKLSVSLSNISSSNDNDHDESLTNNIDVDINMNTTNNNSGYNYNINENHYHVYDQFTTVEVMRKLRSIIGKEVMGNIWLDLKYASIHPYQYKREKETLTTASRGVTWNQAKYNHDYLLDKKYFNHIAFVKQSMMNNNIWSNYNRYNTSDIMKQWIIHFSGQGSKRNELIQLFVDYKNEFECNRNSSHSYNYNNYTNTKCVVGLKMSSVMKDIIQNYPFNREMNRKYGKMFDFCKQQVFDGRNNFSVEKCIQAIDYRHYDNLTLQC